MKANNGKLWTKVNQNKIEIRSVTRADLEEALDILDESFFLNESVCNGCEINLPENAKARAELRELCHITAEDGVSLLAKDATNGRVVAVAFNKIQFVPENSEDPFFIKFRKEKTHSPQAQCLMDFMIDVDAETDVFEIYKIDCVLELMFLATLPAYERQGIGRALAACTIQLTRQLYNGIGLDDINQSLRQRRPCGVTALFTSQFSLKAGQSQGFKVLNRVPFTRFSYNGKRFDERINAMHTDCAHVAIIF